MIEIARKAHIEPGFDQHLLHSPGTRASGRPNYDRHCQVSAPDQTRDTLPKSRRQQSRTYIDHRLKNPLLKAQISPAILIEFHHLQKNGVYSKHDRPPSAKSKVQY
jgi:hypothetical protein